MSHCRSAALVDNRHSRAGNCRKDNNDRRSRFPPLRSIDRHRRTCLMGNSRPARWDHLGIRRSRLSHSRCLRIGGCRWSSKCPYCGLHSVVHLSNRMCRNTLLLCSTRGYRGRLRRSIRCPHRNNDLLGTKRGSMRVPARCRRPHTISQHQCTMPLKRRSKSLHQKVQKQRYTRLRYL